MSSNKYGCKRHWDDIISFITMSWMKRKKTVARAYANSR